MKIFSDYSKYYNLFYKDKDYSSEVGYVEKLIKESMPDAKTILDLGCGTGGHAYLLAGKNYTVCGVDISEEMLSFAKKLPARSNLKFKQGDVRTLKLNTKFDVVVSLFHVVSYQKTNADLLNTFKTVYDHLNENGVFLFDCWYGPAVLTDRPVVRVKRFEDNEIEVIRIAEPIMHPNENTVDVNYLVIIHNKSNGSTSMLKETHKMRYLFITEIEAFLSQVNLKMLSCKEWMSQKEPGFSSWYVIFIIKK